MENLNRIKAVLAETGCTGKWLAEQLGKDQLQFRNGVLIQLNLIYKHFRRLQPYWK